METRESSTAWNEILSAFVQCRYKAYLKLAGQRGRPPDIARCLTKRAKRHRRVAIEAISSSFAPLQMFDGRTAFTPAQSKTARLVTNVEASYEGHAVRGDALLLPSMPPAGAKKPQVELFVCVAQEKVGKSDTTLAACIGFLMSRATGITIPTVTIVYGAAFRQKKLRTADSSHKAASTCAAALKLITEEQPPKLRLNRHCNACEFKKRCRAQAERDDDLSLMQAISEREIARLKIFIVGHRNEIARGALLLVSDLPTTPEGVTTEESDMRITRQWSQIHLQLGIEAMTEIDERGEKIKHFKY